MFERRDRSCVLCCVVFAASACSSNPGTPDAAIVPDAAADVEADAVADVAVPCPGTNGPSMVRTPDNYCIDSTEVTNAQYMAFLTAKGTDTSGQDATCTWNTDFTPSMGWPATAQNHPVAYVDWCDASAYCAWAGKRLCGKIGGGANAFADFGNATKDQWYAACSADGANAYPYGNTYSGTTCNGQDYPGSGAIDVGAATGCVGGFPGIYDMSGNVSEWEDACDAQTGSADHCRIRGGTYNFVALYLQCNGGTNPGAAPRNAASGDVGFRCCAD